MTQIKDDSLAFPAICQSVNGIPLQSGMSLRDYFAAKAMQALIPIYWECLDDYKNAEALLKCNSESAYEYADAMLAAREVKE